VEFSFFGKDAEEKQAVSRRVLQLVSGGLDTELIASVEEILGAGLRMAGPSQ
ncbi:unnamed protein product, partial [Symbiodinium sp. CCMP2456]